MFSHLVPDIHMQQWGNDLTLTVAKLAALFSSIVAAAYSAVRLEPSPVVALFLSGGPLLAVILWLERDA